MLEPGGSLPGHQRVSRNIYCQRPTARELLREFSWKHMFFLPASSSTFVSIHKIMLTSSLVLLDGS